MNREKVIKAMECHKNKKVCMNHCPYCDGTGDFEECTNKLIADALAMLKEQEPILLENQHKPYGISTNANSPWISRCPRCGKKVEGKQTRFCKYCGQAVKWDE